MVTISDLHQMKMTDENREPTFVYRLCGLYYYSASKVARRAAESNKR